MTTRSGGIAIGSLALLAAWAAGCAATQHADVKRSTACSFLGSDCAKLEPGGDGRLQLRYVSRSAPWTSYDKILLEPVTFWGSEKSSISAADQQALCDYFYLVLSEQLGKRYRLVDQPGRGVMTLQVALTDLAGATPGLRTISVAIPQAKALNTLKYAATGTYAFVGGAQAEARLTDSQTGQLLGAWADRRVGGGSFETAVQWQWGDAENAMQHWAATATDRLYALTSGAERPS